MPINRALQWLLVVEAIGAFVVSALMLAASDFLGDTVVPWFLAVIPALFGVMFLLVARQVARRHRGRMIYAIWAQGWVLTGATVGLIFGGPLVLWLAVVLGIAGSAIAIVAQKEEAVFGDRTGGEAPRGG